MRVTTSIPPSSAAVAIAIPSGLVAVYISSGASAATNITYTMPGWGATLVSPSYTGNPMVEIVRPTVFAESGVMLVTTGSGGNLYISVDSWGPE